MKAFISGLGIILAYLTGLLFWVNGILILADAWGVAGALIGIFISPAGLLAGLMVIFASWSTFIGTIIWVALIALMIDVENN